MIVDQVQFLDRHHLFVKFGSVHGGVSLLFCHPAKHGCHLNASTFWISLGFSQY